MHSPCQLWAPEAYWGLPDHVKNAYRCGPGRGILEKLIPDVWRFGWPLVRPLVITPACAVHDYMYAEGPDSEDHRYLADRVFKNNMIRLVECARTCWPVTRVRLRKCNIYYGAVRTFGGPAFWASRNPASEVHFVDVDPSLWLPKKNC